MTEVGGGSWNFVASDIMFTEGKFNFHKMNSDSNNVHAIYMLGYFHVVKYYE